MTIMSRKILLGMPRMLLQLKQVAPSCMDKRRRRCAS